MRTLILSGSFQTVRIGLWVISWPMVEGRRVCWCVTGDALYSAHATLYTVTRPYAGSNTLTGQNVRGGEYFHYFVPRLRWYFTFLHAGRHFRNFPETYESTKYKTVSCPLTFPAWKNAKYQHGPGTKCSGTDRGIFLSQNCNFPEESFILISCCNNVIMTLHKFAIPWNAKYKY